jgi:hypothetical protein
MKGKTKRIKIIMNEQGNTVVAFYMRDAWFRSELLPTIFTGKESERCVVVVMVV